MIDLTRYEGHTPGEWHGGGRSVEDDGGAIICHLSGWKNEGTSRANEALIADAPKLKDALVAVAGLVAKWRSYEMAQTIFGPGAQRCARELQEALALAEAPPAEQVSDSEILDWLEQKGVHHDKFVSGRHLLTFNGKQYSGDTLRAAAVAAMTKDQP